MSNNTLSTYTTSYAPAIRDTEAAAMTADEICAIAQVDALRDKLRGALAMQAMNNAAFLASAEERFNQIAPGGREEYRRIVQAYAYSAVTELIGERW